MRVPATAVRDGDQIAVEGARWLVDHASQLDGLTALLIHDVARPAASVMILNVGESVVLLKRADRGNTAIGPRRDVSSPQRTA
jgi:hypothetical protein